MAQEGRKVGSLKRRVRSQLRDEQLHAVVARSTFRSQHVQNTPCSDHFWKFTCSKGGRGCGAKHISKSLKKHHMLGPLLKVEMSKKWTPLWREARFQVKMCKTHHSRTTCAVLLVFKEESKSYINILLEKITYSHLVGGWATPLKNMSSSIGMMTATQYSWEKNGNHSPPTRWNIGIFLLGIDNNNNNNNMDLDLELDSHS